mmetsp:Transcript_5968/g.12129  ORF Transcript_5968/g.12129 Transcript_5968/m.12129 type:complete len:119 (-) Transcript_5968:123-479(-)
MFAKPATTEDPRLHEVACGKSAFNSSSQRRSSFKTAFTALSLLTTARCTMERFGSSKPCRTNLQIGKCGDTTYLLYIRSWTNLVVPKNCQKEHFGANQTNGIEASGAGSRSSARKSIG